MIQKSIIVIIVAAVLAASSVGAYEFFGVQKMLTEKNQAIIAAQDSQQKLDQALSKISELQASVSTTIPLKDGYVLYHSASGVSFEFNRDGSIYGFSNGINRLIAPFVTSDGKGNIDIQFQAYTYNPSPKVPGEYFTDGADAGGLFIGKKDPTQSPKDYLTQIIKGDSDCMISINPKETDPYYQYYIDSVNKDWMSDSFCKYATSGNGVSFRQFFSQAPGYVAVAMFGQDPIIDYGHVISTLKFDK